MGEIDGIDERSKRRGLTVCDFPVRNTEINYKLTLNLTTNIHESGIIRPISKNTPFLDRVY